MADNVAITAGSGTSIATDDISSVHYQINKIAMGPLNSASLLQKVTVGTALATTTDTTIASSSAILFGVSVYSTETAGRCIVQIRDSTSGSTGTMTTGFVLSTGAGYDRSKAIWFGPQGLKLTSGIRVVLPTTPVATVSVYYISPA
jgi:hypothetical protein